LVPQGWNEKEVGRSPAALKKLFPDFSLVKTFPFCLFVHLFFLLFKRMRELFIQIYISIYLCSILSEIAEEREKEI
jgi:hypothetical protein